MLCKYNDEKQFLVKIKINSRRIMFAKIREVKYLNINVFSDILVSSASAHWSYHVI